MYCFVNLRPNHNNINGKLSRIKVRSPRNLQCSKFVVQLVKFLCINEDKSNQKVDQDYSISLAPSGTNVSTLVYRIDVHAHLLILRKKSPLHSLIWVCTFIDFEKKFPPARLFHPARLLLCSKFHSTHDPEQSIPKHCQSNPKAILKYSKVSQSIHISMPINVQDGIYVQGGTFSQKNKRADPNKTVQGGFFSQN